MHCYIVNKQVLKGALLYDDAGAKGCRIEMFFDCMAAIVNKQVLGTTDNLTKWQCATHVKMKEILGTIQMDNMRKRKIMGQLEELLVEECIVVEDHKGNMACLYSQIPIKA